MENIPTCFVLTGRQKARPYRINGKTNDLQVGNKVYAVPEAYWCQHCDGTGCSRCKGTGIAQKKDRRAK